MPFPGADPFTSPVDPFRSFQTIFVIFVLIAIAAVVIPKLINLSKPVLTREARVIGKRTSVSSSAGTNHMRSSTHTWCYVTFQFADGLREEFQTSGSEYGMMAEGDEGTLVSQGTELRSFRRFGQTDEIG
jgi:hypothetical protein